MVGRMEVSWNYSNDFVHLAQHRKCISQPLSVVTTKCFHPPPGQLSGCYHVFNLPSSMSAKMKRTPCFAVIDSPTAYQVQHFPSGPYHCCEGRRAEPCSQEKNKMTLKRECCSDQATLQTSVAFLGQLEERVYLKGLLYYAEDEVNLSESYTLDEVGDL